MEPEGGEKPIPKRVEEPNLTDGAKHCYTESFRKVGYQDFSTNRLTSSDLKQLNTRIDQLVAAGDSRVCHLLELMEFLNINQIFFS